jgi:hypothetical protein
MAVNMAVMVWVASAEFCRIPLSVFLKDFITSRVDTLEANPSTPTELTMKTSLSKSDPARNVRRRQPGYSHDDRDNGTLDRLVLIRGARSGNGFAWGQPEYLETGVTGYGVFCSLAFDPITDRPVVVHRANNVVRVLRETDAGAWEVDVVDTGSYTSLAIAADGTVHVAYRNDDQLRVASRGPNDPDWTITLADSEVWGSASAPHRTRERQRAHPRPTLLFR